MRAALLVVAACSSAPKPAKPVANNTTPIAPQLATKSYSVPGRQLALEWNVTQREADVALSLRIGTERIPIGAVMGNVYPAWLSYCDTKMGHSPARNVAFADKHGAFAKLTVVTGSPSFDEPAPKGSTTFLIKRPARDRLELVRLGDPNAMAMISIGADAKVEEVIEDEDDRPGFHCGGDDGMNH